MWGSILQAVSAAQKGGARSRRPALTKITSVVFDLVQHALVAPHVPQPLLRPHEAGLVAGLLGQLDEAANRRGRPGPGF